MQGSLQEQLVTERELARAAEIIRAGGVVAFPTATSYGLAADPFSEKALAGLFRLKRRPQAKAVPVLIGEPGQLPLLAVECPALYRPLMEAFWPGPLTLLFPSVASLSAVLTAGHGTVGVRMDPHPVARQLLARLGMPITATSANVSGLPAALSGSEVVRQFGSAIDLVLVEDRGVGGGCSTVVGIEGGRLRLLRAGNIPFPRLEGEVARAGLE